MSPESIFNHKSTDGLLLIGGQDVDSKYLQDYLNFKNPDYKSTVYRDFCDLHSIEKYLAHNKSIFGICRGSQILFQYFWELLVKDRPEYTIFQENMGFAQYLQNHVDGVDKYLNHFIIGTRKADFDNEPEIKKTNSTHHQGAVIKYPFLQEISEYNIPEYENFPIQIDWVCNDFGFTDEENAIIEGFHINSPEIKKNSEDSFDKIREFSMKNQFKIISRLLETPNEQF
jgi:hypothetical protein